MLLARPNNPREITSRQDYPGSTPTPVCWKSQHPPVLRPTWRNHFGRVPHLGPLDRILARLALLPGVLCLPKMLKRNSPCTEYHRLPACRLGKIRKMIRHLRSSERNHRLSVVFWTSRANYPWSTMTTIGKAQTRPPRATPHENLCLRAVTTHRIELPRPHQRCQFLIRLRPAGAPPARLIRGRSGAR